MQQCSLLCISRLLDQNGQTAFDDYMTAHKQAKNKELQRGSQQILNLNIFSLKEVDWEGLNATDCPLLANLSNRGKLQISNCIDNTLKVRMTKFQWYFKLF